MAEEGELLAGQEEVLVGIRLGENVIVFVGDRAVNHLRFCSDIERPYGKTCQIFPVRIGQHRACPVNGATRMRIELRRFVQARRNAVVVSANGDRDIPPHIALWAERCISRKPNARPVLMALLDDELEADDSAARLCSSVTHP